MTRKKGDLIQVRQQWGELWTARILSRSKMGNYLVEWVTGPLKGREARIAASVL